MRLASRNGAIFARPIKRLEIASARTTARTSAIVHPAGNSAQKSKQSPRVAHYPPGGCARRDNRTAPAAAATAADPKQMSLSFRVKRAATCGPRYVGPRDAGTRKCTYRGNWRRRRYASDKARFDVSFFFLGSTRDEQFRCSRRNLPRVARGSYRSYNKNGTILQ